MMIKTLIASLMLCVGTAYASAEIQIHQQPVLQLSHINDLAHLVTQPALQQNWWPGTVIADPARRLVAQQQYQQTLEQIQHWQRNSSADYAETAQALLRQLGQIRVTGRLFTSLDPDIVRLYAAANRTLAGKYDLYPAHRPDTILLLGAVDGAGAIPWQPGYSVRQYLAHHAALAGADKSYATVIAPDGSAEQVPIAYWNQRHVEVMPGSILWLGIDPWHLSGEDRSLNQHIVSLLTKRIPD